MTLIYIYILIIFTCDSTHNSTRTCSCIISIYNIIIDYILIHNIILSIWEFCEQGIHAQATIEIFLYTHTNL